MTGQNLINASGRLINELVTGRSFGAAESADLLTSLNQMIAAWSEERTMIAQVARQGIALTGAPLYAVPTRPLEILSAETISGNGVRRPTRVLTSEEWPRFIDDSESGAFVDEIWVDYAFPVTNVRGTPLVTGGQLVLYTLTALAGFASLASAVDFADGYDQALIYNFAVKIAPEYKKTPSETVIAIATRSRDAIAAANAHLRLPPQAA